MWAKHIMNNFINDTVNLHRHVITVGCGAVNCHGVTYRSAVFWPPSGESSTFAAVQIACDALGRWSDLHIATCRGWSLRTARTCTTSLEACPGATRGDSESCCCVTLRLVRADGDTYCSCAGSIWYAKYQLDQRIKLNDTAISKLKIKIK